MDKIDESTVVRSEHGNQPKPIHLPAAERPPDQNPERQTPEWTQLIQPQEWETYYSAIQALRAAGVRFLLGGAFGLAAHTGRWRNTKDIDFYVLPQDRETAIQSLINIGFRDFYEQLPYDRGWIYRATRSDLIVDLIWGTPNRRSEVDAKWFEKAGSIQLQRQVLGVVPAEELVWIKLYVLQRDRCDWPDVMNLLYATGGSLDWDHLVERLEDDLPLLQGVLAVFTWLCPGRISDIPARLLNPSSLKKNGPGEPDAHPHRIKLLDTRPWFAAQQPANEPMRL